MARITKEISLIRNAVVKKLNIDILNELGAFSSYRSQVEQIFKLKQNAQVRNIERATKILTDLRSGTFNINRYFGKEAAFQDFQKNFKIKGFIIEGKDGKQETLSFRQLINKIFGVQSTDEFYQENKEFFHASGGGTKENRLNKAYVSQVRSRYSKFRTNKEKEEREFLKQFIPFN